MTTDDPGNTTPEAASPAQGPQNAAPRLPLQGRELDAELTKYLSGRRADLAFIIQHRRSGASAHRNKVRLLRESFGSGPIAQALEERARRTCSHHDVSASPVWRAWRNEVEPGRLNAHDDGDIAAVP
jgi:hypothetical protein